jgi:decaprenylphospho-beta-D-ribofuranose 2-oxidase
MSPETSDNLLTGWGRTAPTRASVWSPRRGEDVAAAFDALARRGRGIVARGLGRSYGDAAQNAGGTVVLSTGLDRIIELDLEKGRLTAEAGVSIDTLLRVLLPLGWFPMVVPGTRYVTLGGAVASDIHGKYRAGTFGDYVSRITLMTPARGPISVGPEHEPEVFWATAGGMGLTGVISEVTMQLQPVETPRMVVDTERTLDIDDCMDRMIRGDDQYKYSVAWIDCLARGSHLGRAVLTRGNHASIDDLPAKERDRARRYEPRSLLHAPPWAPNGLLNRVSLQAFNEFWFRVHPKFRQGEVQGLNQFFFPLDGIEGWNRIYGSRGFVQYQCVIPTGREPMVRTILELLSTAHCGFLGVLKRFDHSNPGPMTFAQPGWTLALDIPAGRRGLTNLLDGLDELVLDAGGRIYLTKDSRVRPAVLRGMYPELPRWREQRDALDPDRVLRSDMGRRLALS